MSPAGWGYSFQAKCIGRYERFESNFAVEKDARKSSARLSLQTLALMISASFWLNYYSGAIKAAAVLACVLGVMLVGMGGLSLINGSLIAVGTATVIVGGLAALQRRLIGRQITRPIQVIDDPELGRVSVHRNHWEAQLQAFGLPSPRTLITGTSASGLPTQEQTSLWQAIRSQRQPLLDAAHRALASELRSSDRPAQELGLSGIMLLQPDTFVFFFAYLSL